MYEICVLKIKFTDFSYHNSNRQETIELYYDSWKKSTIGEWCTENNITLYQKEPHKNMVTMETIYPVYISLNEEQYREWKHILIEQKLTT